MRASFSWPKWCGGVILTTNKRVFLNDLVGADTINLPLELQE